MLKIILKRLEELANANGNPYIDYADIVEIVKEIEKEYVEEDLTKNTNKDDWTAIEYGLPPVGKPLIVTIQDHLQGNRKELRYPVYYEMDSMKLRYHWNFRFGDFAYELLPDVSEVIAWQELPQVYQK